MPFRNHQRYSIIKSVRRLAAPFFKTPKSRSAIFAICFLLVTFGFATRAEAAITAGTGAELYNYVPGTSNFSVTVAATANPALFVTLNGQLASISSVTYNGVPLTKIWDQVDGVGVGRSTGWILVNPAAGSHTLAVTWTSPGDGPIFGYAQPWYGVAQGGAEGTTWRAPVTSADGGSGSGSASVTVSTAQSGDMVLDGISAYLQTPTADASQNVQHVATAPYAAIRHGSSNKSAAGSTQMLWTMNSANWAMGATALMPASGTTEPEPEVPPPTTTDTTTITNGSVTTRNVSCSGNITAPLQAAIDASVDGDKVNILAGTCTAGSVSWANKNITVQGQGIGVTNVSGLSFAVTDTTKASFRITGMSVGAPSSWNISAGNRTTGISGWRIDHIAWSYPSCGQNIAVTVDGINWGVLDHNSFQNAGNAIFMRAYADSTDEVQPWPPDGSPGMGGNSWLLPLNLGSDEALYVEDNAFAMDSGCYYGVNDMYYGARMVFRKNSVTNAYWQNHAARGYERGGSLKAEIYNNDFNATDAAWSRAIHLRSGTGVIFNNSFRGYFTSIQADNQRSNGQNVNAPFSACNGMSAWDGNASGQSGWPCLDQIGRSSGTSYPYQSSVPLYVWNNGSSIGCSTNGACANDIVMASDGDAHVLAGRDFINNGTTMKSGYAAYSYPHPLVLGVSSSDSGTISNGSGSSSGGSSGGSTGGGALPIIYGTNTISASNALTACMAGQIFNTSTGQKCSTWTNEASSKIISSARFSFNRNLAVGAQGADVKELQKFLNASGFKVASSGAGSSGNETLTFGPATKKALTAFQSFKRINPASGYFGPITRSVVNGGSGIQNAAVPSAPSAIVLKLGSSGTAVKSLRTKLREFGYLAAYGSAVDVPATASAETDYFGATTESALKKFQCDRAIVCTGSAATTGWGGAGLATRKALEI